MRYFVDKTPYNPAGHLHLFKAIFLFEAGKPGTDIAIGAVLTSQVDTGRAIAQMMADRRRGGSLKSRALDWGIVPTEKEIISVVFTHEGVFTSLQAAKFAKVELMSSTNWPILHGLKLY